MCGLLGGQGRATTLPMYRVDDIEAAVARVRRAGGTASTPERQAYGLTSIRLVRGVRFGEGARVLARRELGRRGPPGSDVPCA
jgi:hypothetical protein